MLLAKQGLRVQLFVVHGRHLLKLGDVQLAPVDHIADIEHADAAIHEVVYIQRIAVLGYRQALRSTTHVNAIHFGRAVRVVDHNLAVSFQRYKQVRTERTKRAVRA